ncbi:hypothetical protein, partial [Streptomyces chiangmaiensis]
NSESPVSLEVRGSFVSPCRPATRRNKVPRHRPTTTEVRDTHAQPPPRRVTATPRHGRTAEHLGRGPRRHRGILAAAM